MARNGGLLILVRDGTGYGALWTASGLDHRNGCVDAWTRGCVDVGYQENLRMLILFCIFARGTHLRLHYEYMY